MQRKFLLNLLLIIFINLLIKPLYIFGVELHVQNLLGSNSYGLYYSLFNLSFILSIIVDPGITNYNNRHIAQNEHLLSTSFSKITTTKIWLSGIYIVAITLYALAIGFNGYEWQLCGLLVLGQIFNSFTLYNRSNLAGLHHFKTDTFISILDKLIMIGICAPILFFNVFTEQFDIRMFILFQTISFGGSALISFYFVKKHTAHFSLSVNRSDFKEILKNSYPYAILASLMLIYTKSDTVLIKELHPNGNEEVGIYAAAYRLIDALNMIAVLFSGLLYPIFSRMIKEKQALAGLVKTAFSILVLPAIVFALFASMNANPIMLFLSKNHALESAEVFRIIIFTFIFICVGYVYGTLLSANGNIKLLNKIALIGVCINLILNIIFIPKYGALASAYIAVLTYGFVTTCQLVFSFKTFQFKLKLVNFIQIIISSICIALLYYFIDRIDINWVWKLSLGMGLSILILWFSRLLPFRELTLLIKEDKLV
jgi:O-antigen/teichoic acid export membrane protein